jgi:hypothetical protein
VLGTTAPLLALRLTPMAALNLDLGWGARGIAAAADLATFLCVAALLNSAGGVAVAALGLILVRPGVNPWPRKRYRTSRSCRVRAARAKAASYAAASSCGTSVRK